MGVYHKRSNIETAYSMIKGKFGSSLRSKSDTGQINEALCKVLAHNVCVLVQAIHKLGIAPGFFASTLAEALPQRNLFALAPFVLLSITSGARVRYEHSSRC
jgi:hypothetical protein